MEPRPMAEPFDGVAHLLRTARIRKAKIALAALLIEINPRRGCDADLLKHRLGELSRIVGVFRNVDVEVKRAIGRSHLAEPDARERLEEIGAVFLEIGRASG